MTARRVLLDKRAHDDARNKCGRANPIQGQGHGGGQTIGYLSPRDTLPCVCLVMQNRVTFSQ